jgi:hypothetical protein
MVRGHPREDGRFSSENRPPSRAKSKIIGAGRNREFTRFPSENAVFPSENAVFPSENADFLAANAGFPV